MIDWDLIWRDYVGISGSAVLGVVASTIVLYGFFSLLMQVIGPRLMARPSAGSFVVLAVVGGITARATLGESPTMLGAVVVLSTLVVLEYVTGRFRRVPLLLRRTRPVVVMVDGEPIAAGLRRSRLTRGMLLDRLRVSGVLALDEVELVILEVRGTLTIVRRGSRIDRDLVSQVVGRDRIPERLLSAPGTV
ncbi:DUF421 domain-containing protein [Brachybacterium halotolerans subsp. kimchii]|uniref:YetF domain-containing protein n=1 Tax=Brachybacterium halotolerans TaxID=2795215 RepID=UPI001E4D4FE2|nr:YetF domain-containing protein [Brachybacterium halotolerans]UEJ81777.1 DUF421 domain-containing protein [Brachybacterium halotolerans subsp. kimchii]